LLANNGMSEICSVPGKASNPAVLILRDATIDDAYDDALDDAVEGELDMKYWLTTP
jgi:hypothetical protein